ncbi:hypothetical protein AVI51_13940 [Piscirickettsia salmonis]|uniref:Transcriptional regulator BolA n=1 Tax=Piscirickettsia salmonis TaxID=1238 RepID=A0A9Q5YIX6_PISSA|nr:BolA/IbaG family iron-sulfur metabolism protein [Piscirickettsia salmonis]ALA24126.1 protein BolA [Piscirickettsia salmonis]APS44526.1 hypothetical protein AVI48_09200 [Piscirickettsia salmonis]APS47887.1 hypothetical protein AVI49_09805 [Piscirickettsia salmonis]APS51844.1 hypothetical protein AVI50_14070 [Piscirickettsia salmonis]APS55063.1 hypothetical protein AVI51_13940 [Piscirickettsia salmonis]
MKTAEQIEQLVSARLDDVRVFVEGDGRHFQVVVVGDCFVELSQVKRQQHVYSVLMDEITSGQLHAVNIKAYTLKEWGEESDEY